MRVLIFCPASHGGIAEHAHYQARALVHHDRLDLDLVLLCSPDFLDGRIVEYKKEEVFSSRFSVFSRFGGRFGKMLDRCLNIWGDQWRLAWEILRSKPDVVLVASYSEYLAPFWIWPHFVFARFFGVTYVANLHDPVRDYQVGPKWWHDLSVKLAYLPISVGVVHQRLSSPSPVPLHVKVVEAPVGVYDLQESVEDPKAIRAAWGVVGRNSERLKAALTTIEHGGRCEKEQPKVDPKGEGVGTSESNDTESTEGAQCVARGTCDGAAFSNPSTSELARDSETTPLIRSADTTASSPATSYSPHATPSSSDVVFLAFGFIRDNKNLDLVIRALASCPQAHLVVMGKAQSQKDKPVGFYLKLAKELGVETRVKFYDAFVPDEKLGSYFAAADVVVLTYDGTFHSQSGVLNVAARARRPVLASSGESPLKDCVQKYNLGVFVAPDSEDAIARGMKHVASDKWRVTGGDPNWSGYEAYASGDGNVQRILDAVKEIRGV